LEDEEQGPSLSPEGALLVKIMKRTAFITGITGQDGSYLAELLLEKGYKVVGLVSKKHGIGEGNISHLKDNLILEPGDLLDRGSLERVFKTYQPSEIYNLAALTFVPTSWEEPELVGDVNGLGVARLLSAMKEIVPQARFYQASSSEMFGGVEDSPQNEQTPFKPKDPYAVAKVYAHHLTTVYREKFGLFTVAGILYNHESPRRGYQFVTRKVSLGAVLIKKGKLDKLPLGNLEAEEDWGFAGDYVKAIYMMVQADQPKDYVVASGQLHTVGDVCQRAFSYLGLDYQNHVVRDERFFRPKHKVPLVGDASLIQKELGWQPEHTFEELVEMMVQADLKRYQEGRLKVGDIMS
jgi:GDPmannose 4,6-dehydratase